MSEYEDVKKVIYKTLHKNKKTIEQIADEMGIDVMSLYKYGLPEPSGSNIPLKRLVPLMKTTNDFSILEHLAKLCEFIIIKVPRFKASKGDSNEIVSSYQKASADAVNDMITFFKHPTEENYKKVSESLHTIVKESVGAQKYIDKEYIGQTEIFE